MRRDWTPLAVVYLVLALVGLVGTLFFNVTTVALGRDFFADLSAGGPAVSSLSVDLLVVAIAGSALIIVEARRLGIRFGWLFVALSLVTAFAFTFPLFLAVRERRLVRRRRDGRSAPGA